MGSNWLFGVGLDAATAWVEFGLAWLVQSTAIIGLGLLAAALVRRRNPAILSVVYQTALVAVLAAPVMAYALSATGMTFISITLPEARYQVAEIVEPTPVAAEPLAEQSGEPEPNPTLLVDALENLDVQAESEVRLDSNPATTFPNSFPDSQLPLAPLDSPQPQVAASSPAPSAPPAPAEPIVRRVVHTNKALAAAWVMIPLVWLVGSFILISRLLLDHCHLHRLRSSAEPVDEQTLRVGKEVARQVGTSLPQVLRTPLVASPCLCGLFRPAILLPEEIDADALPAVLVHELAHRKRGDLFWNLLRHLASCLLWPQPLLWQLSRRLEAVAEDVCDDYVVAFGGCPQTYAAALVAIAQRDLVPSEAAVSLVTFRSMLGQRVHRILDVSRRLSLTVGLAALLLITAGGASAALVAGLLGPGRQAVSAETTSAADPSEGSEQAEAELAAEDADDSPPPPVKSTENDSADNDIVTVRGVVLDPRGKPVAGARVIAVGYQRDAEGAWSDSVPPPISETQSRADGSYEISFRKSQCDKNVDGMDQWHFTTIAALHPGFAAAFNDYNLFDDPHAATLQLVEDEPIRGRIVDLEGQPISGATVRLRGVGRNEKEDISQWISAMREGVSYVNSAQFDRPHHASRTLRFLNPEPATTDAEGRFTLSGLGKNRYAILRLTGPRIALADIYVVTMPIENFLVEMGSGSFKRPIVYHGSSFQFAAPPSQLVSGVVRDADTKRPIAGARVILDMLAGTRLSGVRAAETTTDAQGRYEFEGMPRGEGNQFVVVPPDDQPYFVREFDDVPIASDFSPVTFDMELQRGIWITGRVTEQDAGKPLDARMYYLPWPDNPHIEGREQWHDNHLHGPQTNCLTDSDGRYRLVGLPGRGLVAAWCVRYPFPQGQGVGDIRDLPKRDVFRDIAGSFAPTEQFPTIIKEIHPAENETHIEVDVAVQTGDSLEIHFVDTAGRPVQDLKIQGIYPKATSSFGRPEKYSSDVTLLGLRPDESRLLSVHSEAAQLGKVARVARGDAKDGRMTVALEPTITVVGRLLDGAGDPLNTAQVTARPSTERDYPTTLPPTYTDADGQFSLELLPGCQYDISQTEPSIELSSIAEELAVSPGETIDLGTIDVTQKQRPEPRRTPKVMAASKADVSPAAAPQPASEESTRTLIVRGTVLAPDGKPLGGAKAKLIRAHSTNKWAKDVPKMETTSDSGGRFEFEVPAILSDGYRQGRPWPLFGVIVTADGVAKTHLRINDEAAAANATVRMTPFAPLEGRIVNLEGQPVPGVNVQLHQVDATDSGDLGPYLAALRAGKSAKEIDDAVKPRFGFGDDGSRKANLAVTDADGRFRLDKVGKHHIALLRFSGAGIVLREIQVANTPTEPVPFGDNSRNGDEKHLYGSPFEYAVEPSPAIVGIVTDAETREPIVGVKIGSTRYEQMNKYGFDILETTTDELGRYRLEGVRPKPSSGELQRFVVRSTGETPYLPREFDAPEAGEDLAPIQHDIELHRGVWIEGRVTDAVTGKPVAAKVEYLPWYDNPRVDHLPEYQGNGIIRLDGTTAANTDEDGSFKLIGIAGRGLVQIARVEEDNYPMGQGFEAIPELPGDAEKFERLGHWNIPRPEYNVAIKELNIAGDAKRVALDFHLKPGKTVTISTVDTNGNPIEVNHALGLGTHHILRTHKDVGNRFEVLGLTDDEIRTVLMMNTERRLGAMLDINLADDASPERAVKLVPLAAIVGRLVDGEGQPLLRQRPASRDDVKLIVRPHGRSMHPYNTETDVDGRFELLAVPGQIDYSVYADAAKNGLADNLRVEPGEKIDLGTIDVTSKERPPIKRTPAPMAAADAKGTVSRTVRVTDDNLDTLSFAGQVVSPEGKPVADAKLYVIYYTPNFIETKPLATSGEDGKFRFAMKKSDFDTGESGTPWEIGRLVASAKGYGLGWVTLAGAEVSGDLLKTLQAKPNYAADPNIVSIDSTIRLVADDVPVEGRLLTLEGQPIPGARVRVIELHGNPRNSLDDWIDAVENKQADYHQANQHLWGGFAGLHLRQQVSQLFPEVKTDADGRFRLSGIGRERIVMLQIEGQGIETRQVNVRTRPGKTYELLHERRDPELGTVAYHGAKFELPIGPSRDVVGTVRDEQTGEPLPGATIVSDKLAGQKISGAFHAYIRTTTDAEGKYRLSGLPIGENRIVALPAPTEPRLAASRVVNVQFQSDTTVDFQLSRGLWIRGQVTDSTSGKPLRAWVEYFAFRDNPASDKLGAPRGSEDYRTTTDAEGRFEVRGVPGQGIVGVTVMNAWEYPRGVGSDTITHGRDKASGINFRDDVTVVFRTVPGSCISTSFHQLKEVNPAADAQAFQIDFALKAGPTLAGALLDPEGKPLTGAMFADGGLFNSFRPPALKSHEFTVLNFEPNQPRRISFYHSERKLAGSVLLTGSETSPIEVKLTPWATVTGRVLQPSGESAENVDLVGMRFGANEPLHKVGLLTGEVRTDDAGRFRIEMLAAETPYALSALQGRMTLGTVIDEFQLSAGETKDLGDLTIQPIKPLAMATPAAAQAAPPVAKDPTSKSVSFSGTVLGPDEKPQSGAKVALMYRHDGRNKFANVVETGADGTFLLQVDEPADAVRKSIVSALIATADGKGFTWAHASSFETSGELLKSSDASTNYFKDKHPAAPDRTLRLVDDLPISGRLVDLEGRPLAGVAVRVGGVQENRAEGLARWIASVERGDHPSQQRRDKVLPQSISIPSDLRALGQFESQTDAEGRFQLAGVGRERLVALTVTADGYESRNIQVRTQPGDTLDFLSDPSDPKRGTATVYPPEFSFALAPSRPIIGTVRDHDTGAPLAGVQVGRATTDAGGRYRIEGMSLGEQTITAKPADDQPYLATSGTADIDLARESAKLDFKLKRGIWIEGRVTDRTTGEPVPGRLTYFAFAENPNLEGAPKLTDAPEARTQSDGTFRLLGLPGRGLVTFLAFSADDKYVRGEGADEIEAEVRGAGKMFNTRPYHMGEPNAHRLVEINPPADLKSFECNLTLTSGPGIKGTVLDPEGKPLEGAYVAGLATPRLWTMLKDSDCEVRHLAPGERRRIFFFHEGRNLAGSIELNGDDRSPFVVKLQPTGTITGRVLLDDGDPAAHIEVAATSRFEADGNTELPLGLLPNSERVTTDREGRFTIRYLAAGHRYPLMASRNSYLLGKASGDVTVTAGETKDLGDLTISDLQD